jgi:hypothetical protein
MISYRISDISQHKRLVVPPNQWRILAKFGTEFVGAVTAIYFVVETVLAIR